MSRHRRVTTTLFDGQRLDVVVPEIVGTALCRHGRIEPDVTQVLLHHLRPGDTFLDIGAHYGYFSVIARRRVGSSGRVVAFEPGRATARLLRANLARAGGAVVEECAAHEHAGTIELRDFGAGHSALNTVLGTARVPPEERRRLRGRAYAVAAVSLDGYCAAHGLSPAMVKIDAEGAETAILRGMRRVLHDAGPLVAVETGDYEAMASPATSATLDLMASMGYRAFEGGDDRLVPHRRREAYGYGNLFFLPADGDPVR